MKRFILINVLIAAIIAPALAFTFNPDHLNLITFTNRTDTAINYLFLSPGDSEYWGPEILGSTKVLEPGASLGFWILYPDECNDFDIMAIDANGKTAAIYNYTICDERREEIEIVGKDMRDDAPEMDYVTVYIRNDTITVWYLFISPSDSTMWGVDYLDETSVLEPDDYVSFIFPLGSEPISFDLMAVDSNLDTYTFSFDVDEDSDYDVFVIELTDLDP